MASGANIFAWGANMHMMIMDIMSGISLPQCVEHAVEWCGQARDRQNYVDGMEIFRAMMVRSPPTYASACCVGLTCIANAHSTVRTICLMPSSPARPSSCWARLKSSRPA